MSPCAINPPPRAPATFERGSRGAPAGVPVRPGSVSTSTAASRARSAVAAFAGTSMVGSGTSGRVGSEGGRGTATSPDSVPRMTDQTPETTTETHHAMHYSDGKLYYSDLLSGCTKHRALNGGNRPGCCSRLDCQLNPSQRAPERDSGRCLRPSRAGQLATLSLSSRSPTFGSIGVGYSSPDRSRITLISRPVTNAFHAFTYIASVYRWEYVTFLFPLPV